MQNDSRLGEIFMRAFLLRRVELLAATDGDAILLGSLNSNRTLGVREFLTRNGHPHSFIDLDREADLEELLEELSLSHLRFSCADLQR